mmetsp:Transcript_24539/g.34282  ORF Transcript_24539/g.34282 Transcript_24539/m.34282 type:complete len:122 (+) Transcript_24539:129-494(+)
MFCPMCGHIACLWRVPMDIDESGVITYPTNFRKWGRLAVSQNQVLSLAASSVRKLGLRGVPKSKSSIPYACLPSSKGGRFDPGYIRYSESMKKPPKKYEKKKLKVKTAGMSSMSLLEDVGY